MPKTVEDSEASKYIWVQRKERVRPLGETEWEDREIHERPGGLFFIHRLSTARQSSPRLSSLPKSVESARLPGCL